MLVGATALMLMVVFLVVGMRTAAAGESMVNGRNAVLAILGFAALAVAWFKDPIAAWLAEHVATAASPVLRSDGFWLTVTLAVIGLIAWGNLAYEAKARRRQQPPKR